MQQTLLKLTFTFILGINLSGLHAQMAIPVSGGMGYGYGGSVSYTVGQIIYTTNTETTGSVSGGIQQPYEISTESGSELAVGISLQCSVYPIPVDNILTLLVHYFIDEDITCRLYDSNSQLLLTQKVEKKETLIILTNLPSTTYYLIVEQKKQKSSPHVLKTFKIIKK